MVVSPSMLAQIKSSPTMIWGWFELEEMQAWKLIFPLNPESKKKGLLPLSNPAWMEWECPWWIFPSDKPTKGEAKIFRWRALSPQSLARSLKDLDLEEEEEVRRVWMSKMGVVKCWGNEISKTLLQVEVTPGGSNLLITSREAQIGVLQHLVILAQGGDISRRALRELGWRSLSKTDTQNLHKGALVSSPSVPMNILLWNCRGALNPHFHVTLNSLIDSHTPDIVVVTKTCVGGDRAKGIMDRLPFDGALHADTIGYSGGIWVLWKSNAVEVMLVAKIE